MKALFNILTLLFVNVFFAQNIGLDTSFDSDGKLFDTSISEFPQAVFFEDNKYIFVFDNGFCSKNYDGTTNTSFGVNGKLFFNNSSEVFLTKGAKINNGHIYIFGEQSYNSSSTNKNIFIAKIATSGVFDTSFGTNGFLKFDSGVDSEIINDLIVSDDGKIYAIGTRTNSIFVCKVNSNGTLDMSFNSVGYKSFPLTSGDGSKGASIYNYSGDFLLVGSSVPISFVGIRYLLFMKMDSDGNLTSSYGNNGLKTVALSRQGETGTYTMLKSKLFADRLYIVYYYGWSFNNQFNRLVKFNLSSDAYSTVCYMPFVKYDYTFDGDENIYITGTERCSPPTSSFCMRNYDLSKRNSSGILDPTFNATGQYSCNFFPSDLYSDDMSSVLFRHTDGKILIAGKIYNPYSPPGVGTSGFTAIRVMDTPLSTDGFDVENISVYPNPATEELNINLKDNQTISSIEIRDLNGRLIQFQKSTQNKINIENLSSGIYFIKIKTEVQESILKFIKE